MFPPIGRMRLTSRSRLWWDGLLTHTETEPGLSSSPATVTSRGTSRTLGGGCVSAWFSCTPTSARSRWSWQPRVFIISRIWCLVSRSDRTCCDCSAPRWVLAVLAVWWPGRCVTLLLSGQWSTRDLQPARPLQLQQGGDPLHPHPAGSSLRRPCDRDFTKPWHRQH